MQPVEKEYDVIVVGGGHAGVEAALAAARLGCQTLLLTTNPDTIAKMSCNPAIGGQSKGHLVREIDALGGEMGKAADMAGIQFRMLNKSKGPAVWSPRAQCDKRDYEFRLKLVCEAQPNLETKQGQTTKILHRDGEAYGVETAIGVQFVCKTVVITTGTFMGGLMHIGMIKQTGGRAGEQSPVGLSASLSDLGLTLGRLKTGTPPRLDGRSIDFNKTEIQNGDEPVTYFTFWGDDLFHVEHDCKAPSSDEVGVQRFPPTSSLSRIGKQVPCFITHTTELTARLIEDNISLSPLYSGIIKGTGPRYCPSIEDKIIRFKSHARHQIFLEPEGLFTNEVYVNGLSTSMPYHIQKELVRTVIGCERASIVRPAYAVEYDFVHPTQLFPSLETKVCRNLYLAGQINGTSGYEEAAAQGIMAGLNAARRVRSLKPIILGRDQAYIGVLIDDLVTKGTVEPYRMFTSRAEYRLILRQDNADLRLSDLGHEVGLLSHRNYRRFTEKRSAINDELARLHTTRNGSDTLAQVLRRPEVRYETMPGRLRSLDPEVIKQVEIAIKYAGYIDRQNVEIEKLKGLENKNIPESLDYALVPSLRLEARQKLGRIRPATIGQASRISGVSPADISILLVWLRRQACTSKTVRPQPCTEPPTPEIAIDHG